MSKRSSLKVFREEGAPTAAAGSAEQPPRNYYDEPTFFANYRDLGSANEHVEIPAMRQLLKDGDLRNARVLDLGCGTGMQLRRALGAGARLAVGVDWSRRMLREAAMRTDAAARALVRDGGQSICRSSSSSSSSSSQSSQSGQSGRSGQSGSSSDSGNGGGGGGGDDEMEVTWSGRWGPKGAQEWHYIRSMAQEYEDSDHLPGRRLAPATGPMGTPLGDLSAGEADDLRVVERVMPDRSSGGAYDVIMSSLMLHYLDLAAFRTVLRRARAWLAAPRGILVFSMEHPVCTASLGRHKAWYPAKTEEKDKHKRRRKMTPMTTTTTTTTTSSDRAGATASASEASESSAEPQTTSAASSLPSSSPSKGGSSGGIPPTTSALLRPPRGDDDESLIRESSARRVFFPLDCYAEEGPRSSSWVGVAGVVKHHRTLATVINELVAAGFVIEQLLEPTASVAAEAGKPKLRLHRKRPPFLMVRARPAASAAIGHGE